MNCLCCGKILTNNEISGWHKKCLKNFFKTDVLPEIDISDKEIKRIVDETINKGFTITGVQKKLSIHLSKEGYPRLTIVNYPFGYILKPQVDTFIALPESEHLAMSMAEECGISTVPHALILNEGKYVYITKRIDRIIDKKIVKALAMEDFCQLDLRLTKDKYKGSYERCSKIIKKYSCREMYDLSELFLRLLFCYVIWNSDMHLKNFSLIETYEKSGEYVLSPAYDLLPLNIIMPEDTEETALTLNGKKKNLHKEDFLIFAENCGISNIAAEKMIEKIKSKENKLIEMCNESLMPDNLKSNLAQLIHNRCSKL